MDHMIGFAKDIRVSFRYRFRYRFHYLPRAEAGVEVSHHMMAVVSTAEAASKPVVAVANHMTDGDGGHRRQQ